MYYLVSFSSIAKARTVRTFPRASSATAVALATCSCAIRDKFRRIEPKTVPPRITTGNVAINSTVSLGEIMYKEMTQPTVWVVLRKPWDTHCLKALLKSWTSAVSLEVMSQKWGRKKWEGSHSCLVLSFQFLLSLPPSFLLLSHIHHIFSFLLSSVHSFILSSLFSLSFLSSILPLFIPTCFFCDL